jgi:hypothetical protein
MTRRHAVRVAVALGLAFSGGAAKAAIKLVNPVYGATKLGRFVPFGVGGGTYGVEVRSGNGAANGDWEIGVGRQTSVAGAFTAGQRTLGCVTTPGNQQAGCGTVLPFSLSWSATALSFTLGGTTVVSPGGAGLAGLSGDTLRIWAKRDASFTITDIDGTPLALSGAGITGAPAASNDFYIFSPDNWRGDGLTLTGTMRVAGGRGSSNEIFISHGSYVPEPATWAMLAGGFGIVGAMRRRRRVSVAS